eukprot:gene9791-biopygen384
MPAAAPPTNASGREDGGEGGGGPGCDSWGDDLFKGVLMYGLSWLCAVLGGLSLRGIPAVQPRHYAVMAALSAAWQLAGNAMISGCDKLCERLWVEPEF